MVEFDPIPLADLNRQYKTLEREIHSEIGKVASSADFINGPAVGEFEEKFSALVGLKHGVGVNSGTDALTLSVLALSLNPGDEVITVPNTWISTAFAISHAGATPVFVDVDVDTHQMDPKKLTAAITEKTKAIIPVHMYGHPAPMVEIMEIASLHGLRVVEDVAQAPLASVGGRLVGSFGDLACFSFYPSKNLGAFGDGGMVLTDNDELAQSVRQLADYGQSDKFVHKNIGFNSRLDTIQAAVLLCKLPYLRQWTEARRRAARLYKDKLKDLPVKIAKTADNTDPVFHLFVVSLDDRDRIIEGLRNNGVMAQIHYPSVIHLQHCYNFLGYKRGDFPAAEHNAAHCLSLPIYPEIRDEQIECVVETLSKIM